jgi:hypothetical protein
LLWCCVFSFNFVDWLFFIILPNWFIDVWVPSTLTALTTTSPSASSSPLNCNCHSRNNLLLQFFFLPWYEWLSVQRRVIALKALIHSIRHFIRQLRSSIRLVFSYYLWYSRYTCFEWLLMWFRIVQILFKECVHRYENIAHLHLDFSICHFHIHLLHSKSVKPCLDLLNWHYTLFLL